MRNWLITITILLAAATAFLTVLQIRSCNILTIEPDQPVQVHSIVLEEIEGLGKMELIRYQFQDVISHEIVKDWWPDPKVMLFVRGETVGCVDFTKIDSTDIYLRGDSVVEVVLPMPEVCFSRLMHDESKVYNTENTFWDEAEMVAEAYQKAEEAILTHAIQAGILEETKSQAQIVLKPLLEAIAGKEVELRFSQPLPNLSTPTE